MSVKENSFVWIDSKLQDPISLNNFSNCFSSDFILQIFGAENSFVVCCDCGIRVKYFKFDIVQFKTLITWKPFPKQAKYIGILWTTGQNTSIMVQMAHFHG